MVVHSVVEQSKQQRIGLTRVTTKCGITDDRNSAARLPDHLTCWHSLVTCPGCLA